MGIAYPSSFHPRVCTEFDPSHVIAESPVSCVASLSVYLFGGVLQMLTFDDYGISGHPNHTAVYRGALALLASSPSPAPVTLWVLESTNLLRKYLGLLDLFFSLPSNTGRAICSSRESGGDRLHALDSVLVVRLTPWESWCAMATHASQWVWYRRLFVLFSRYTYINTIVCIQGGQ